MGAEGIVWELGFGRDGKVGDKPLFGRLKKRLNNGQSYSAEF